MAPHPADMGKENPFPSTGDFETCNRRQLLPGMCLGKHQSGQNNGTDDTSNVSEFSAQEDN